VGRASSRLRPHPLGELVVVALLVKVYDWVRSMAAVRGDHALGNALDVLNAEKLLHLDMEAAMNRWLTNHTVMQTVASLWYQYAHLTVSFIVLGWCYWKLPHHYRWLRSALVMINLCGLMVFALYPVMPPRLLPGGKYVDSTMAAGLGKSVKAPITADEYAAMPSLHVAWAIWVSVVVIAGLYSGWRLLAALYPVITMAVIFATANHYVLDAVAGLAVAGVALAASGMWYRWFWRKIQDPQKAADTAPEAVPMESDLAEAQSPLADEVPALRDSAVPAPQH
jgi:hypothetical protein